MRAIHVSTEIRDDMLCRPEAYIGDDVDIADPYRMRWLFLGKLYEADRPTHEEIAKAIKAIAKSLGFENEF